MTRNSELPAESLEVRPGRPDDDAIARILFHSDHHPILHFNYRSADNKDWDRANRKKKLRYQTEYPAAGRSGLVVEFEVSL